MTDEQMRERMKEIDKERDKLRSERQEYENYFIDKKRKELLDDHKNYIGKCFVTCENPANEQKYIKAFKILEVLDSPNERYASCIALIDGYRSTCWKEYGTQIITIGLWTMNKLRMAGSDSDPKVIDMYKEISHKQFEKLYLDHNFKLDDEVIM